MNDYKKIAQSWLAESYDTETRTKVRSMIQGDPKELEECFYKNLEFGTGGLRGIMGVGTNRMNKYTVGMATQGFANYLKENFSDKEKISVAVSFDSRNNSREFARITSDVFAANGFEVYLFDNLRPTPELSFAIRYKKCQAGVMVTASHNPKEYNGYKAYWEDGAQITAPHDVNIVKEVSKITDPTMVNFGEGISSNIHMIGAEVDKAYLDSILSLMLSPEAIAHHKDMKIVYTPLHGCGVRLVPDALRRLGFEKVTMVPEQAVSDGDFPTVISPNPEEPSAMKMGVELAEKIGANLVMATDPDADRMGIAVRNHEGELVLLSGNQTAAMMMYYILTRWKELGKLDKTKYTVKTIVTTELLKAISDKFGVEQYDVLTGFKYICEIVRENEGKKEFICGGEESYGFNVGEFARDKDAVIACSMIAECSAWAADQGMSLYDFLMKIYTEFGVYKDKLVSVVKKGKDGSEQIAKMMDDFRTNPPRELAGSPVVRIMDCEKPEETGLPKSNVLRFFSKDGSVVTVRPSGTEPKIKFYFGTRGEGADEKMSKLIQEFK